MSRRFMVLSALILAALASGACKKRYTGPEFEVTVPPQAATMRDAIPLDYGDLVGVAPGDKFGWAQLFFQRPDKSIVVVTVNGQIGYIADKIVAIPRR